MLSRSRLLILPAILASLSACNAVVLDPSGDVASQQANLVVVSTILMLIIIIPVMALTVFFAWKYRQSNTDAAYEPDWDHSMGLELVIWAAPLLIIICLGALTWLSTHLLDPYRALGRVSAEKQIAEEVKPLEVNVVALDWKWLFIYPEYGIATVNDLAAPLDRPIQFKITSSGVMNSFYIPALAGQIYAMPGMETKLHAVINKPGKFEGFSANYSGAGFSGMRFAFHGLNEGDFQKWVGEAKAAGQPLDRARYLELERPSENVPVIRYAGVETGLYNAILNMCVEPGKMCMHEMMSIDAKGGLGLAGIHNVRPLEYDKNVRRGAPFGPSYSSVGALCTPEEAAALAAASARAADEAGRPVNGMPMLGAGLPRPGTKQSPISSTARADAKLPSNS